MQIRFEIIDSTAIRTVANPLPENGVIFLTLLISKRYIPYTDLRKFAVGWKSGEKFFRDMPGFLWRK